MSMYVHYRDDGPSGPCGQSVSITSPWSRIYIYDSEDDAVAFMRYVQGPGRLSLGRRRPRVENWWSDESVMPGPVVPEADRG